MKIIGVSSYISAIMVTGLSSRQLGSGSRDNAQLPLAHGLANRTLGRVVASVLSSDKLPDLSAEQVKALPHLLVTLIQSRTSRIFTDDTTAPRSCLVSPAKILSEPDGKNESITIRLTYLFYDGHQLRACNVSSSSAISLSPDTIRGICELHYSDSNLMLNPGQSLRLYGQDIKITSASPESVISAMMTTDSISAEWVAKHLGLSTKDGQNLASIIESALAEAPRINASSEFVKTLDEEVTSLIRSSVDSASFEDTNNPTPIEINVAKVESSDRANDARAQERIEESQEIAHQIITQYNTSLASLEKSYGALQTPLDVEDAIKQLTPMSYEGVAALSCAMLIQLLNERRLLEQQVFKVSDETADPRLVELLEKIEPEIKALNEEITRRKDQGDIWTPDDNVNFVVHAVDLPLSYAAGYERFDFLLNIPPWRLKSLKEEEYEELQRLPLESLVRVREILKFFQQTHSSEAELLRTISDHLRTGLSEDKRVRFGGTREEHRYAFIIEGDPLVKVEFEIGDDLDVHGSPRCFVHNVKVDPFQYESAKGNK